MRFGIAALFAFVAGTLPGLAKDKPLLEIDAYLGTWTGSVSEQGVDVSYPITLHIFERGDRVFHNTRYGGQYDCDGGGLLLEAGAESLHFFELITRNRRQCADGHLRLYPSGDGKLLWEWFYPDGTYAARADLSREE